MVTLVRKITRAGLRTQLVEYMKKKKIIDNGDDGTVIDRKLIISNNITTNSRFNHDATTTDATAAIVVVFAIAIAVLRAFMCVRYPRRLINNGATKY